MAGMIPVPAFAGIYATSKFAIRGMSDALRLALGPYKIGVSVLCPGFTRTRSMTHGAEYRAAHDHAEVQPPPPQPPGMPPRPANAGEAGMDPLEVGERVLEAILGNRPYIFPHMEFVPELRDFYDEMLAAFPTDQEIDPIRRQMEERRAKMTAEAKAIADAIDD
jgi:short-subunit dehydrogenase